MPGDARTSTTDARRPASSTRRLLLVAGAVAVLGGGAAWAIVASRDEAPASQARAAAGGMEGMPGMEGMAGMQMDDDGSVQLPASQLRQFGVTFGTVEMRTLESEVRAVGNVTVDETRVAQVAPRFGGFVERLHVETTGQPVRRGQPLMEVYSPELLAAQEELLVARRLDRTLGESAVPGVPGGSCGLVEAARQRLRLLDVSEAQIDLVLRTGRARRTITIHAPSGGVVIDREVVQGQAFQPGEPLYTIGDLSAVWVDVDLRETDIGSVRSGTAAQLEFTAYPGRPFPGRVAYVYPTLQQESRTVRARVEVTNGEGLLKPGMYATVRLTTPVRRALTVPSSAVVRTGERNLVFVDMGGGAEGLRLMPHEVEVGRSAGDQVEVLAGVEPGQRVVTSAQFLLESESNLGEVMKAMMSQMGSGDMGSMGGMDMKDMPGTTMPGAEKGADMRGMPGMTGPSGGSARGTPAPAGTKDGRRP